MTGKPFRERLALWWWGEDEAPGLGGWLEETCRAFTEQHGVSVELCLLRHDEVLPALPAATARGEAPDLHFFWNGIYLVDRVWQGLLAPFDDLLTPSELAWFGGGPQSRVGGKTYRVAWYVIPVVWVANCAVLERAGVDRLPAGWDELREDCERVRSLGLAPITAGDGEGDLSVWWLTHFLTQALDEVADAPRLVLGELDWRDRRYCSAWSCLREAVDAELFEREALPLTLWDGLRRFNEGKSAFTLASGPMFAACRRALGSAAAVFPAPVGTDGPLAGLPIVDTQGVGMTASCRAPAAATDLLRSLHAEDRRARLWENVRLFSADRRWQGPGVEADADYRRMWAWYTEGPNCPYIPNLMPLELHYRLAADLTQAVLAGRLDPASAGIEARERAQSWVDADPERAATYAAWAYEAATASISPEDGQGRYARP